VCHIPDRDVFSLYPLLSDGRAALTIAFDASVPVGERDTWQRELLESFEGSAVEARPGPAPNAAPVAIEVGLIVEPGSTPDGIAFHAAVARATLRLHRATVHVRSRPGVSIDEAEATRKALTDLVERVVRALTW
jgi:hypothetical protein